MQSSAELTTNEQSFEHFLLFKEKDKDKEAGYSDFLLRSPFFGRGRPKRLREAVSQPCCSAYEASGPAGLMLTQVRKQCGEDNNCTAPQKYSLLPRKNPGFTERMRLFPKVPSHNVLKGLKKEEKGNKRDKT